MFYIVINFLFKPNSINQSRPDAPNRREDDQQQGDKPQQTVHTQLWGIQQNRESWEDVKGQPCNARTRQKVPEGCGGNPDENGRDEGEPPEQGEEAADADGLFDYLLFK